ncbi:MAG: MFS transporter [Candidatus Thiodiazotropha sp. (ex Lucinoma borealis)]|nr:MFS transporter [Candidatus Thiodiazotropha sp. (ex Lucinoma borealis)]MCU7839283.1 MFS transporter [Candidatus Thiodiazotropha sp. (ex Troendleina suluensis)]MCU7855373.1 MFS transporter [Candidatus Thiodiazotropha sp. (ex Lucinoma borealis)]MCU7866403.1 MFS transporter [Candidatus Thiodiazotropha sp. (ex Lucinoma borealis)]MCU7870678.1 MFS transporter [Candidatus Thiodiazotropha sp. (ex Lucinoma borealis)]
MPYWRLSGFYFFYFASLGALVPFWGLYLQARDFSPVEIGELMAVIMATKLIAPYIWGWISDHTGHRMPIVRLASLLSAISFLGIFFADGFFSLALVMMLFSFFWNASLPQFEAVTMSYLQERIQHYSRVRLWGSIGFILTVVALGFLLDEWGVEWVPKIVLLLYFGIFLFSLIVPENDADMPAHDQGSILQVLKRGDIIAFLLACFFMQASHGAYYAFYSIYMEEVGYSSIVIGLLWALGVIAEVLVFLVMHQLLHRWGARKVLIASLAMAVVRWILVGSAPENLLLVLLAQVMHAATFGTFHAAAIHMVHHYFVGRHQGRGQALYSSISFGAGGAFGSLLSGYLWIGIGAAATYWVAAGYALLALIIAWRWIDHETLHY